MNTIHAVAVALLLAAPARAEEGLRLFAAGSLTEAMTAMLAESGLPQEQIAAPVFGPSGCCGSGSRVGRQRTCWPRPTWRSRGGWRRSGAFR